MITRVPCESISRFRSRTVSVKKLHGLHAQRGRLSGRKEVGVLLALGVQATGRCCIYSDDSETQIHVKLSVLKKQGYLAQRRLTGQGFTDLLREEHSHF